MAKVNVRGLQRKRKELVGRIRNAVGYVRNENSRARNKGWMPALTIMNESLGAVDHLLPQLQRVEGRIQKTGARITPHAPRLKKYAQRTDKAIDGAIKRAIGVRMKMPRKQSLNMSYQEHGKDVVTSDKLINDKRMLHYSFDGTPGKEFTGMSQADIDRYHDRIMSGDFSRSGIQVLRPTGKPSDAVH